MTRFSAAAAAAAAFALAAPLAAQTAPAAGPAPAPESVTRAQGEDSMRGLFAQLDANHDGAIDSAEIKGALDALKAQGAPAGVIAHFQKMFDQADPGKTGKISLDAWVKSRMAAFDRADTNHDGKLDAAELAAVQSTLDGAK